MIQKALHISNPAIGWKGVSGVDVLHRGVHQQLSQKHKELYDSLSLILLQSIGEVRGSSDDEYNRKLIYWIKEEINDLLYDIGVETIGNDIKDKLTDLVKSGSYSLDTIVSRIRDIRSDFVELVNQAEEQTSDTDGLIDSSFVDAELSQDTQKTGIKSNSAKNNVDGRLDKISIFQKMSCASFESNSLRVQKDFSAKMSSVVNNSTYIMQSFTSTLRHPLELITSMVTTTITTSIRLVKHTVSTLFKLTKNVVSNTFKKLTRFILSPAGFFVGGVIFGLLRGMFDQYVMPGLKTAWDWFYEGFQKEMDETGKELSFFQRVGNGVCSFLKKAIPNVKKFFTDIANFILDIPVFTWNAPEWLPFGLGGKHTASLGGLLKLYITMQILNFTNPFKWMKRIRRLKNSIARFRQRRISNKIRKHLRQIKRLTQKSVKINTKVRKLGLRKNAIQNSTHALKTKIKQNNARIQELRNRLGQSKKPRRRWQRRVGNLNNKVNANIKQQVQKTNSGPNKRNVGVKKNKKLNTGTLKERIGSWIKKKLNLTKMTTPPMTREQILKEIDRINNSNNKLKAGIDKNKTKIQKIDKTVQKLGNARAKIGSKITEIRTKVENLRTKFRKISSWNRVNRIKLQLKTPLFKRGKLAPLIKQRLQVGDRIRVIDETFRKVSAKKTSLTLSAQEKLAQMNKSGGTKKFKLKTNKLGLIDIQIKGGGRRSVNAKWHTVNKGTLQDLGNKQLNELYDHIHRTNKELMRLKTQGADLQAMKSQQIKFRNNLRLEYQKIAKPAKFASRHPKISSAMKYAKGLGVKGIKAVGYIGMALMVYDVAKTIFNIYGIASSDLPKKEKMRKLKDAAVEIGKGLLITGGVMILQAIPVVGQIIGAAFLVAGVVSAIIDARDQHNEEKIAKIGERTDKLSYITMNIAWPQLRTLRRIHEDKNGISAIESDRSIHTPTNDEIDQANLAYRTHLDVYKMFNMYDLMTWEELQYRLKWMDQNSANYERRGQEWVKKADSSDGYDSANYRAKSTYAIARQTLHGREASVIEQILKFPASQFRHSSGDVNKRYPQFVMDLVNMFDPSRQQQLPYGKASNDYKEQCEEAVKFIKSSYDDYGIFMMNKEIYMNILNDATKKVRIFDAQNAREIQGTYNARSQRQHPNRRALIRYEAMKRGRERFLRKVFVSLVQKNAFMIDSDIVQGGVSQSGNEGISYETYENMYKVFRESYYAEQEQDTD